MKLLLDECVPKRLRNDFPPHEVSTLEEVGFKGLKNGQLLRTAANQFDALLTVDRRMPAQQHLSQFDLALIVLIAKPCRYAQLKLLVPRVLELLENLSPVKSS
jgi:predicted nuclease of predicted toxin-antitoxin system